MEQRLGLKIHHEVGALVLFKRTAGIGSIGMNGTDASTGSVMLPEKGTETVAFSQTVPEDLPPVKR